MAHPLAVAEGYRWIFEDVGPVFEVDPNALQALMMIEGSGELSISPAGARGIMQAMPNWWTEDEWADWTNPVNQVRAGARALRTKLDLARGDYRLGAAYYFGIGVDAGGMDTNTYVRLFDQAYAEVQAAHPSPGEPPWREPPRRFNIPPWVLLGAGLGLAVVWDPFAKGDGNG